MKIKLKQIIRKHHTQPDALLSALSTITPAELAREVVDLITTGELRLHSCKPKRSLCECFYRYHRANPQVGEWFLGFRISNDFQSCYVRYVLMRDRSLCGVFTLSKTSDADPLVVDGRTWTDFAKEHQAELWPQPTPKKKPAKSTRTELGLRKTA